jgi:hypothetical protein
MSSNSSSSSIPAVAAVATPTPYDIYLWRNKNDDMSSSSSGSPMKVCRHRMNPFVDKFTGTGNQFRYLRRFAEFVRHDTVYSPSTLIALMVTARLFVGRGQQIWQRCFPSLRPVTRDSVVAYNLLFPTLKHEEVLEIFQLAREFVRPRVDVKLTMERYSTLIDEVTLLVLGQGSSKTNLYRLAVVLALLRLAFTSEQWATFARFLWQSGACTFRAIGRLSALYRATKPPDDNQELIDLVSQWNVPEAKWKRTLGL